MLADPSGLKPAVRTGQHEFPFQQFPLERAPLGTTRLKVGEAKGAREPSTTPGSDLETAFTTFSQQRVGAVLVSDSTFYARRMEQIAALAARHALPAIFPNREYALAGGLMS